jgi:hypothetical protein
MHRRQKKKTLVPRFIILLFILWMEVVIFHIIFDPDTASHANSAIGHVLHNFKGYVTSVASNKGLSACLLVNDENPRLPEWMAYHFHVLPLRSLIVAVDPKSRHLPHEILLRWVDMGVQVNIWNDADYLANSEYYQW